MFDVPVRPAAAGRALDKPSFKRGYAVRDGSVLLGQPLCSESDLTRFGYFAASQMPVAAPSESPLTCASSTPIACMNVATSSANISVEYTPAGLSDSPVPRRSTEMQVKCFE